jgi:CarD family transcriptional regulator
MFNVGSFIVYKKSVCKIKEIKNNKSYILIPIDDNSLKIEVPIDNSFLRSLITKEEINKIINEIPSIPIIEENDKLIESAYKEHLKRGSYRDLISIIKTTYLRNKRRIDEKKKLSEKDTNYFNLAEKYLYNELSVAMNMSFDEVKEYIISKMES